MLYLPWEEAYLKATFWRGNEAESAQGEKKGSIPIKASWAAFSHISWLSNPDVYCWKCTRLKINCRLITLCQEAAQLFFKFATIAILKVAMYLPSFKTVLEDFISGKHNWDKPFHQNKTAEIRCFLKSYFHYFGTFRSLDLCWSLITIYETATTEGWVYAPCCYSVCPYIYRLFSSIYTPMHCSEEGFQTPCF